MEAITKNPKIWIILLSSFLSSCLGQQNGGGSDSSSLSKPKGFNSALSAESQASVANSYQLVRLDGTTPVDGTESGPILVCTRQMEYCTQTCLSIYMPSQTRWSVFSTGFLLGGKCAAFALAYPDGQTIPRIKYWIGSFVYNAGQVTGRCSIDYSNPDFDGRAYFDFVRPQNSQAYYVHNFYDLNGNPVSTVQLLNYLPPGLWTFHDASLSSSDITPQLSSNYSCVKESDIGGAFQ